MLLVLVVHNPDKPLRGAVGVGPAGLLDDLAIHVGALFVACSLVARPAFGKLRAVGTTTRGELRYGTGTDFHAAVTRLAALTPFAILANRTVNFARHKVALFGHLSGGTFSTAVGGLGGDSVGVRPGTGAAGSGALAPVAFHGHTVHGACLPVAGLGCSEGCASLATVIGILSGDAGAGPGAAAASGGAVAPVVGGPSRDDAVDGACLGIAVLGFDERGASNAAECDVASDGALAAFDTSAARVRAFAEGSEVGNDAINRARFSVAFSFLVEDTASDATISNISVDGTGTGLLTSAAGGSASAPFSVFSENAIGGTILVAASLGFVEEGAHVSAMVVLGDDIAAAGLETRAASLAALAPVSEVGDFAVDGAGTIVAALGFGKFGASNTAMLGLGGDFTGP